MKTIVNLQPKLLLLVLLSVGCSLVAQTRYKENFKASKDMTVQVNTSYTNVIFETWDKDLVEVEAFVDGENLTEKEKKEIFNDWKFDVLGNSQKVVITSNPNNFEEGIGAIVGLDALKSLESLKALERLGDMPSLGEMPKFDFAFNFDVPEVPDFREIPDWPFSKSQPSIKRKDGYTNYHFNDDGAHMFDQEAYEKDKAGYVAKLNKKYGTNVTVKQVDRWLEEVDVWADEFSAVMEKWGEEFGKNFSDKFSQKKKKKMEAWGEEFGKKMEAWGEEFGEKFGQEMEAWGEEFGEKFGKEMEEWAKQFEDDANRWTQETDKNGNKIIYKSGKDMQFHGKANKTIIVRMPKGTKTDVNVKYGELKMASAYNVKATLNYATLTANSIDGGKTLIDASYAPVYVNNWNDGSLKVSYVEDCRLNNVKVIDLHANSSDVNINELTSNAILSGSFGNLYVLKVSPNFKSIDIVLENADAVLSLPNTDFQFYYNGKKSNLKHPKALQLTETKSFDRQLLKGYHQSNSSTKSININANYSNITFQ